MADVKGMGKANGVDGKILFNGNTMISPTGGAESSAMEYSQQ